MNGVEISASELQSINGCFSSSSLTIGGLVFVPTDSRLADSSAVRLSDMSLGNANRAYVFDQGTGAVYAVGASVSGNLNAGSVYVLTPSGVLSDFQLGASVYKDAFGDVIVNAPYGNALNDTLKLASKRRREIHSRPKPLATVAFGPNPLTSLSLAGSTFNFGAASGGLGNLQLNSNTGIVTLNVSGVSVDLSAGSVIVLITHWQRKSGVSIDSNARYVLSPEITTRSLATAGPPPITSRFRGKVRRSAL